MRTRLAPLIVVKQEPSDDLGASSPASSQMQLLADELSDDNNNKSSFLLSSVNSRNLLSANTPSPHPPTLLHSPSAPVGAVVCSPQQSHMTNGGHQAHQLHRHHQNHQSSGGFNGYDDSNNNKSCEVNRNQFVHQDVRGGSGDLVVDEGLYRSSVVDGIKVEKCYDWFGNGQDNNNSGAAVQVKREFGDPTNNGLREERVAVGSTSSTSTSSSDSRKSRYPRVKGLIG